MDEVEAGKLSKAEKEKERERKSYNSLYSSWPLPNNVNEMKSFAWGKFTWMDLFRSAIALIIPIAIVGLPLSLLIPSWIAFLIGGALGIPLIIIVNKHMLTGDLPIEERLQIFIKNIGSKNLLSWDKTKMDGHYLETSTQSFVPDVNFEDNFVILNDATGGFSIIKVETDELFSAKYSTQLATLQSYRFLLNNLLNRHGVIPIQIYLKSVKQELGPYVDNATDDLKRVFNLKKNTMYARAYDYRKLMQALDYNIMYHYEYYIIITYREDAEEVGNDTMKSISVKRDQLKEKANPFQKKMKATENIEFQIGDDREKVAKENMKDSNEFSRLKTIAALTKRTEIISNSVSALGGNYSQVEPETLGREEIARLIYDCFNDDDKYTADSVLKQALANKTAIVSTKVYDDCPELFEKPEITAFDNAEKILLQKKQAMTGRQ